jgi:hypothetical protein
MTDVAQGTFHWYARELPPQLLLPLQQLMRPPIPAVEYEQVKCEETRRTPMEHEIVESWLAPAINGNDLAIEDRVGW